MYWSIRCVVWWVVVWYQVVNYLSKSKLKTIIKIGSTDQSKTGNLKVKKLMYSSNKNLVECWCSITKVNGNKNLKFLIVFLCFIFFPVSPSIHSFTDLPSLWISCSYGWNTLPLRFKSETIEINYRFFLFHTQYCEKVTVVTSLGCFELGIVVSLWLNICVRFVLFFNRGLKDKAQLLLTFDFFTLKLTLFFTYSINFILIFRFFWSYTIHV